MIRSVQPSDTPALVALGVATGLFNAADAETLLGGTLSELHSGRLGPGHQAVVSVDDQGSPLGWAYFGPTPKADGVWDLWWIGVSPTQQRKGVGEALLAFAERKVKDAAGRLLVIETSSLPATQGARNFYAKKGYEKCGCIPSFYGDGDDKVIFVKRLL